MPGFTLRRSRLTGPDGKPPKNDYEVRYDGRKIGRIYLTPNRTSDSWFWAIQRFPSSPADSGHAPDLEAAKERLKRRWRES